MFKINGSPRVLRTDAKTDTADVGIDWSVSYNPETVKHLMSFLNDLAGAKSGDEDCSFTLLPPGAAKPTTYQFQMYTEAKELLFDNSYNGKVSINAYWIPAFSLSDSAGKIGAETLFPVRCLMAEDDIIGDDTWIRIYEKGSFSKFKEMYTGSVWMAPAKWKEAGLKPELRLAVLKGIKKTDLEKLNVVKVALAAVRLRTDDKYITF